MGCLPAKDEPKIEIRQIEKVKQSPSQINYTKTSQIIIKNIEATHKCKIVVVGNSGVGKTDILAQYAGKDFHVEIPATIGLDFIMKTIQKNNKSIQLQIWDTAGQERFRATVPNLIYKKSDAIIFVFDITDINSFNGIKQWHKEFQDNVYDTNTYKILVGNKTDLKHIRTISQDEANNLANCMDCVYIETSAKNNENVIQLFEKIIDHLFD